jgi:5-methylcytosine-specific restriction endonuclease McrBC regulatory subunit McrC
MTLTGCVSCSRKVWRVSITSIFPKDWTVAAGKELKWRLTSQSAGSESIFPTMNSDIILEHRQPAQRIIIDTKFNNILIKGWYRDRSLRSGYIYQMYTYLRAGESNRPAISPFGWIITSSSRRRNALRIR